MTDYDLGKARGKIVLDYDERGFRKAEGANDRLAQSAHRVAEGFVDAEQAQNDYNKQVKKTQQAEDSLQRKQADAQKALNRLNEAQGVANRLKAEGKTKTERYKQAVENAQKAQNRYSESVAEAAAAESKLNNEVDRVNKSFKELQRALDSDNSLSNTTKQITALNNSLDKTKKMRTKVDVDTDGALGKIRRLRKEHDGLIKSLTSTRGVTMGLKVGGYSAGGMALGGLAGLTGGGLTGFGVNGIMASVQALGQLSGLAGLLPVVFGNLATTIGTVVIASQGMGDAFSAVAENDAEKLSEALKKLSTSGQEMALAFNQIYPELENFQKAVQQEFFKGLADEMKQLANTYLPLLQDGFGRFAQVLNWTLKDLADWAKQSYVIEDFKTIMDNLANTMGLLAPSARMLADTFLDIFKVSTDFGPSLASSFQLMVKDFRDFINTARADGSLARWIQTGIDSFKSLMTSLKQFGQAFGTIFEIQNKYSGGFFGFLERISSAFNAWTKSSEGNAALNEFFRSITELGKALTPVLASLANIIIGQIIPMFADFGTAIQPGILAFLSGFSDGMKVLGPVLQQMAPAMNQLLAALGKAFADILTQLGPELPALFQTFVDAIIAFIPHIPEIVKNLIDLANTFMQFMPGLMDDIGKILPWFIRFVDVITFFKTGLLAATTQIIVWIGKLAGGIVDFLENLIYKWPTQAGDAVADFLSKFDIRADIEIIKGWFGTFFSNLGDQISTGWGVLMADLGTVKDKVWEWFKDLPSKAFETGRTIVEDLMRGIADKLGPLGVVAKMIVDTISDYLPQSPAKKGPFSGKGWTRKRGEKLAQDFAEGIVVGSGSAGKAGGTLSKATESGMTQFVSDMLQFTQLGQSITSLIGDIANNVIAIAKFATTNPLTGESIFKKKWQVTATPDELRRMKEDKAFQDKLKADQEAQKKAEQDAKKIRPDNVSPSPAGAELVTQVPKLDSKSTRRDVLAAIVGQAQQRGFSPEEVKAIVATSIQESGLDPTKWDPSGQWLGLFQQDNSYTGRQDPNSQISEFLKRLQTLRGSGGSSGNIWKDIFWLQQAPGAATANEAYNGGRQGYLGEIMARSAEADRAVQEVLKNPQRPLAPGLDPGGMQGLLGGRGGRFNDAALLARVPNSQNNRYVNASEYTAGRGINGENARQIGDLTQGLGDCTSTIEDLVAMMDGRPTGNRSMATGNAAQWARENGFLPTDRPMPGTFQIGWNGSHMQATLPGGTNWNWGDNASAQAGGRAGGGAWDSNFNFPNHWYRPVSNSAMQRFGPQAPAPAPPPPFLGGDTRQINPLNDPTSPAAQSQSQFTLMNENLDQIASATTEQLTQQDVMINELRAQNPMLDAAINIAKDPNSTDAQVGDALGQISDIAATQRQQDTAQSRYIADGLDSMATEIAGGRGMAPVQQDPIGTTANLIGGALGVVGDVFKVMDTGIKAIGAASNIADTVVRGIQNTEDIYKIVDEIQKFYDLAAAVSQTISDGLALAGTIAMAAGGGQDGGLTGSILQAAAAVTGIVTSVIQTINAGIDIAQEVYDIGSKYFGKWLSKVFGAGQGSLMGDVRWLLDKNTMELKTWSGDNPSDKRTFQMADRFGTGQDPQQGKIRDINMYIGPGTDPNEAMNAAMWSIKTDRGGVFTSAGY